MRRNPPQPELFSAGPDVEVTRDDLAKNEPWAKEALRLIDTAYAPIGGHANLRSVEDILADDADVYVFEDIDQDLEPDIVHVIKTTPFGRKLVASGNKGTREAKKTTIIDSIDNLRTFNNYAEVSGQLAKRMLDSGVPVVGDKRIVEKVLKKPVRWIGTSADFPNTYGWYERTIGGHPHQKILVGLPKVVQNPDRRNPESIARYMRII